MSLPNDVINTKQTVYVNGNFFVYTNKTTIESKITRGSLRILIDDTENYIISLSPCSITKTPKAVEYLHPNHEISCCHICVPKYPDTMKSTCMNGRPYYLTMLTTFIDAINSSKFKSSSVNLLVYRKKKCQIGY